MKDTEPAPGLQLIMHIHCCNIRNLSAQQSISKSRLRYINTELNSSSAIVSRAFSLFLNLQNILPFCNFLVVNMKQVSTLYSLLMQHFSQIRILKCFTSKQQKKTTKNTYNCCNYFKRENKVSILDKIGIFRQIDSRRRQSKRSNSRFVYQRGTSAAQAMQLTVLTL